MKYFIYCRKSSESEDRQLLSIESQLSELQKKFAEYEGVEIVGIYQEAFSAKAPGRGIFNEMLSRIERGDAAGMIAWAPDRLARNSIDGGRIIYLLDQGIIRDLKFATYTFENNSQGKFMLQIMFGQSKYYSDALSENVKRGNRTKIERGGWPNRAPIGYRNDKASQAVVPDPEHFPYVRKLFELMLTATHSIDAIVKIANEQWGYRTPCHKHSGGKPLRRGRLYKIFTNPFYAGRMLWCGQLYSGKHLPMISVIEFDMIQALLGRPRLEKRQIHTFPYRGLIRCGACGLQLTAENKVNGYGRRYVYYHCTRIHRTPRCRQPSIEVTDLERQLRNVLQQILIPDRIHNWTIRQLIAAKAQGMDEHRLQVEQLRRSIADIRRHLANLTDLRVRGLIDDDDFLARRQALQRGLFRLQENLQSGPNQSEGFELHKKLILFSNRAISWFDAGDSDVRRKVVEIVSSNLTLKDKIVSIEAKKPFVVGSNLPICSLLRAERSNVRTCRDDKKAFLADFQQRVREYAAESPEQLAKTITLIDDLEKQFATHSP
jgi:DNA invertase Pin-like site-specific DNA recombinase